MIREFIQKKEENKKYVLEWWWWWLEIIFLFSKIYYLKFSSVTIHFIQRIGDSWERFLNRIEMSFSRGTTSNWFHNWMGINFIECYFCQKGKKPRINAKPSKCFPTQLQNWLISSIYLSGRFTCNRQPKSLQIDLLEASCHSQILIDTCFEFTSLLFRFLVFKLPLLFSFLFRWIWHFRMNQSIYLHYSLFSFQRCWKQCFLFYSHTHHKNRMKNKLFAGWFRSSKFNFQNIHTHTHLPYGTYCLFIKRERFIIFVNFMNVLC